MRINWKEIGFSVGALVIAMFVLYGISSLLHQTTVVFFTGGTLSLILSLILTGLLFMIAFSIPNLFLKKEKFSWSQLAVQFVVLIVTYVILYLILVQFIFGVPPWDVQIQLTSDMYRMVVIHGILLLLFAFGGSFVGVKYFDQMLNKIKH